MFNPMRQNATTTNSFNGTNKSQPNFLMLKPQLSMKNILHFVFGRDCKGIETALPKQLKTIAFFICSLFYAVGGGAQTVSQTFSSSGSFTAPDGVTSLTVKCWGGGGAGGGATGNPAGGGGGAGGGYAEKVVTVIPGNMYTVTVAGLVSGTAAAGTNGEPSWFSTSSEVYAKGGTGGGLGSTNNSSATGGLGSVGTNIGDIIFDGGDGGTGATGATAGGGGEGSGIASNGNNGGVTIGGFGGVGGDGGAGGSVSGSGSIGLPGDPIGGGGGGGRAGSNTDRNGGDGGEGQVSVTWTCPTASISYAGNPFCIDGGTGTVTFSGQGGGTYAASPAGLTINSGSGDITPSSSMSGTYTVTYTYSSGCTTTTTVDIEQVPVVTTLNACIGGGSITFTQSGGLSGGTWSVSGGGTIVAGTGVFTPSTEGCYTVTYTINNCSDTKSFVVFPTAPPAPTVNPDCGAITVTPPASVAGFNIEYSFDDGATWGPNTPPVAENCSGYLIKTRYVTSSACGANPVGTASSNAVCEESAAATRIVDLTAPTGVSTAGSTGADACLSAAAGLYAFDALAAAGGYTDNCGGSVTAT